MINMKPRVKDVKPMDEYQLLLTFTNNEIGIFDVSKYLSDNFWSSLKDISVFKTVKVGGGSIEWENGVDFCPDDIYENSKIIGKLLD